MTATNKGFEIGDWVKGKSRNGELIRGYIETIDPINGIIKVNVLDSDNDKSIGKTVATLSRWVAKLSVAEKRDEEDLGYLIDLALITNDEPWFMELTTELSALKQASKETQQKDPATLTFTNRLG
ncbi:IDEAL domain-containing protein [Bacillus canaveralius]|uniref:IDEAL domain-containing protein n=1 Tax=Bacillus canaveralius TaxID=1403243 RepID=UPI0021ADC884|nr:IDEAL domain-containing protein [Bacillus canaveralius]